ncbi:hypothetical protein [Clostridium weizhouense]|uniref:Uncharacterized protein n=1 Tax=Clostridium weizhouense TaxID=2859781 RepID=A0ABS7AP68_9CLOT|nr:hypothetical protein [Clostridium weizhouense]MBW6410469.1 hypothetical protein [Clostridium weizhouense]
MQKPPTEKSFYFHTLIFNKTTGVSSIWGYVPNEKSLLGYFQYSFLQEAFFYWINGNGKSVTNIPSLTVEAIIKEGEKLKQINKETALKMRSDYEKLKKMWDVPVSKIGIEVKKFIRGFNSNWSGDSNRFLYLKVFKTPEELGEFVVTSGLITNTKEEIENKIGVSLEEWENICKYGLKDKIKAEQFRNILLKKLTEVF